jgi:hypothetical protein
VIKKPRGRGGHSPRWAAEPDYDDDDDYDDYDNNNNNNNHIYARYLQLHI